MRYTLILFLSFFLLAPAHAQQKDSVKVSVEALKNLKAEHDSLKKTVTIQDSIISEQASQIELWQRLAKQDSTLLTISEKQLEVARERIELRDDRIKELEKRNFWRRVKTYLWTAGGILIGFLAGSA